MSIAKMALLVGASIVTAGGTAAVATRDKWWPKGETSSETEDNPEIPPLKNREAASERSKNSQPTVITPGAEPIQGH